MLPILSLSSWSIAFAKLTGVLAVLARLAKLSRGMSGSFLQPRATGLNKLTFEFI
jgi:hypothetical protein